jgi:hypothetical protein
MAEEGAKESKGSCVILFTACVQQALIDRIERCCSYVEAEIEYKGIGFWAEIAWPSSQLEERDKRP